MTEHNDRDLQNDPWWKKMMGTKKEHLVEKLEKALAEIEGQKAFINEERNTVQTLKEVQEELEVKNNELKEKTNDLEKKKIELEKKKNELDKKKNELNGKESENDDLKIDNETKDEKITELEGEIGKLKRMKSEVERKKTELERKKNELTEKINDLEVNATNVNEKVEELEAENRKMKIDIDKKKTELETKKSEIVEKNIEIGELRENDEVKTGKVTELEKELERMKRLTKEHQQEKTRLAQDLSKSSLMLAESRKLCSDLEKKLSEAAVVDGMKSVLLILDPSWNTIKDHLRSDVSWEMSKSDINTVMADKETLNQMKKYDKVVVCMSAKSINEGKHPRDVARNIVSSVKMLTNLIKRQVAVIPLTPSIGNQASVIHCNSILSSTIRGLNNIQLIQLEDTFERGLKSEYVKESDGHSLTSEGIISLAQLINEKVTIPDECAKGAQSDIMSDDNSNEQNKENISDEIEEIIPLQWEEAGKIIGEKGANARALRAKLRCGIHVDKYEMDGRLKRAVKIKGKPDLVEAAVKYIKNLLWNEECDSPMAKKLKY